MAEATYTLVSSLSALRLAHVSVAISMIFFTLNLSPIFFHCSLWFLLLKLANPLHFQLPEQCYQCNTVIYLSPSNFKTAFITMSLHINLLAYTMPSDKIQEVYFTIFFSKMSLFNHLLNLYTGHLILKSHSVRLTVNYNASKMYSDLHLKLHWLFKLLFYFVLWILQCNYNTISLCMYFKQQ